MQMNKLISLLRNGLARLGSFGRKREDDADEPAPSKLADTVVDVQTAADAPAPAPAENEDGRPSGLWSRLMARFSLRKKSAGDESEAEPPLPDAKGDRADRRAGDDKGAERGGEREGVRAEAMEAQEQEKGFWSRLMARLSLRKKAAGDESEAEPPLPDAKGDRADRRAGGGKGTRAHAEALEGEAPAEQPKRGGVRGMLARKPVWISLVVLAVAGISAAGWFAGNEFRARSDANARMLQQRNQALAEQNRKLQAENARLAQAKNKPHAPASGRDAGTDPMGEPDAAQARSAGRSDDDCTVKDAASVRDTLKGCIEGFNAGSGR